ncbi:YccF domain-containing protein [Haloplasma contractile]|uniref:Cobaltochelatase CobN protein n=1 Tax=Haloplasma contractile SSD-17B TaxID=1033810 RepID=U2EH05_9MOLU|nr:YccF domain-containing protein [Haloplasma contractile]ERJ13876.1 cobaltochelatase CobN protein [Haloplasma contractile SSD-17B]
MSLIGNILWLVFGGIIGAISWFIIGISYCLTIIGIPFGLQAFKIGVLTLFPFGAEIRYNRSNMFGMIGNIIWLIFGGIELSLLHLLFAIVLGITIIGIPFSKQHLKLAKLSLMPFGSRINQ